MSPGGSVMPTRRSSSSRLLPCDHLPAVLTNAVPLNVLPPVLGMMLNAGPPRSTLAHAARDGHLDLLRVHEIVGEARDAAAAERRPDVHAVHLDRAFVAASAPRREEEIRGGPGHRLGGVHVEGQRLDPGHHRQDVAVGPRGRNRGEHLVGEHDLRVSCSSAYRRRASRR